MRAALMQTDLYWTEMCIASILTNVHRLINNHEPQVPGLAVMTCISPSPL